MIINKDFEQNDWSRTAKRLKKLDMVVLDY